MTTETYHEAKLRPIMPEPLGWDDVFAAWDTAKRPARVYATLNVYSDPEDAFTVSDHVSAFRYGLRYFHARLQPWVLSALLAHALWVENDTLSLSLTLWDDDTLSIWYSHSQIIGGKRLAIIKLETVPADLRASLHKIGGR